MNTPSITPQAIITAVSALVTQAVAVGFLDAGTAQTVACCGWRDHPVRSRFCSPRASASGACACRADYGCFNGSCCPGS